MQRSFGGGGLDCDHSGDLSAEKRKGGPSRNNHYLEFFGSQAASGRRASASKIFTGLVLTIVLERDTASLHLTDSKGLWKP